MIENNRKRMAALPSNPTLATAMVVFLLSVSILSLAQMATRENAFASEIKRAPVQVAQTAPIPAGKDNGPAQSDPGGARPTTPAPEPARPDADAQKAGAQPALPAAPAEKVGEPIKK
jgi:hypothetical protein